MYKRLIFALAALTYSSSTPCFASDSGFDITVETIKVSENVRFQAISLSGHNIWLSGTESAIFRSHNNGHDWHKIQPPSLNVNQQFRDIEVDGSKISLMAAGLGSESQLHFSNDAGQHWQLVQQGSHPSTFYDCVTQGKHNPAELWLYGDSVEGKLFALKSDDFGQTWQELVLGIDAEKGEGGFAASGTCISSDKDGSIAIGTGNNQNPRILFKAPDKPWQTITTPFSGGEASGIFSLQIQQNTVYAFGGGLNAKDKPAEAYTYDFVTKQWSSLPEVPLHGAIYGSAITDDFIFISNPEGIAALSRASQTWQLISVTDTWALACNQSICWGAGADGHIVKIHL
ncbi:kelch repeat-containing protein [Thalassotalea aquiviva]|uniref:kelch repeat-containing protein n=1 Tax=Thalassotalea aquiviva TaxID=3242415 RepID=UPI00352B266A